MLLILGGYVTGRPGRRRLERCRKASRLPTFDPSQQCILCVGLHVFSVRNMLLHLVTYIIVNVYYGLTSRFSLLLSKASGLTSVVTCNF